CGSYCFHALNASAKTRSPGAACSSSVRIAHSPTDGIALRVPSREVVYACPQPFEIGTCRHVLARHARRWPLGLPVAVNGEFGTSRIKAGVSDRLHHLLTCAERNPAAGLAGVQRSRIAKPALRITSNG